MTVNDDSGKVELDENGQPPNQVSPDQANEEHRVGEQDPNGKPDEDDENLEDTQPAK